MRHIMPRLSLKSFSGFLNLGAWNAFFPVYRRVRTKDSVLKYRVGLSMHSVKQKSIVLGFTCLAACLAILILLRPNLLKQFPVLFEKEGNSLLMGIGISILTSTLATILSHYFFKILFIAKLRRELNSKASVETQNKEGNFDQGFAYCRFIKEGDVVNDFKFIHINKVLNAILSIQGAEGKKASELFSDHKSYLGCVFDSIQELEKTAQVIKLEYKSPNVDRWFGVTLYSPGPGYFCFQMEDALVSEKLSEQGALLAAIINTSKDAIFSKDVNGLITSWNPAAEKLFEYTQEEALGMPVKRLVPENLKHELELEESKIKQGENITFVETKRLTKSGQLISVALSVSPLTNKEGERIGASITGRNSTETKITESGINKSVSNHKAIFENSSEAFVLIDRNFILQEYNTKAQNNALLNQGSKKLHKGVYLIDCIALGRREGFLRLLERALAGETIEHEADCSSADENPYWLRCSFKPVLKNEVVEAVFLSLLDITKNRLAEAKLKESEGNLRAIFENSSQGFVLLDAEGKIKAFNQETLHLGLTLFGTKMQIGSPLFDFVAPSRIAFLNYALLKASQGETIEYRREFVLESLTCIWVEVVIRPVYSENKVIGSCISAIDVTEKVINEQEKEFDRKNLESLINNTNDLIFSIDRDFKLISYNKAFADFNQLEIGRPNIIGESMAQGGLTKHLFDTHLPLLKRAFDGETFTQVIKNAGHQYGWSEASFFPIVQNDDVIGTACFIRNITERIENERLINKNNEEKEKLFQILTHNVKDLQQFAYITSHNLRGPVANLLGLANLLDNYDLEDQTLIQILDGIKSSALRFDETIRDLSNILTIKDNPSAQVEELQFSKAIEQAKTQSAPLLKELNAKIMVDFSMTDTVVFNRAYFESIITNLLSNAIKYRAKERPLIIKITSQITENWIVFKFHDNGIGMDVNLHKEKLFKLYQRFHSIGEGKGLGLFLIKSQLETLGGAINVESTVNKGTEFILQFKKY